VGLLIRNGEIVNASERFTADVYCEGGRIADIGARLEKRSAEDVVLDAGGKLVLPGFIDPHVHMELAFMGTVSADDFESGTASGVAGGTTCIIDFCMQGRGQSLTDAVQGWHAKSAKAVTDYTYHMAITDFSPDTPAQMRAVVQDHGITSFKVFMAYKGALMVDDNALYQVMREAAKLGAVVTVHAENGDAVWHLQKELLARGCTGPEYHPVSRPSVVEGEATERALMMARIHGATAYIVHMTCKESMQAVERAKAGGQHCYGETCPQYLLLDDSVFDQPDFGGSAYVMSPPIRPSNMGHHQALWSGLSSRLLDSVGTDHCPFTHEQKKMGALGSAAPARIFGLTSKGAVAVGKDADLVLFDPGARGTLSARTHHSRADRSIFEGFDTRGRVATTIVAGQVVWDGTKLMTRRGSGRFLARTPTHFAHHAEVKLA
jgi:dihydropyrimidinase